MSRFQGGKLIHKVSSTASSGGTLSLANNSARYQQITGTQAHTVQLPTVNQSPPNECPIGLGFVISNRSTGVVTINYGDGSLATTLSANTQKTFFLYDNSTAAGIWDISNEAVVSGGASLSSADKLSTTAALANQNYQDTSTITKKISFNPEEVGGNFWTNKGLLTNARDRLRGFSLNGFGYAPSGYNGSTINSVERYDDTNNYWLSRASVSQKRSVSSAFSLNNFGYIAGGSDSAPLTSTEQYNDATDSWSTKSNLNTARQNTHGYSLGGYGFANTGILTGGASDTPTIEAYSDANNAWYYRANIGTPKNAQADFALNDFGYSSAGYQTGPAVTTTTTEKFNYVSNTWTVVAPFLNSGYYGIGSFSLNGFGYLAGGTGPVASVGEYSDFSNSWRSRTSINTARFLPASFSVNNTGYIVGGNNGSSLTSSEQYRNFNYVSIGVIKKSSLTPSSIFVASAANDLVASLPVQIRTDGDNWKPLTANQDSALKTGETLKSKFKESGLGYISCGQDLNGIKLSGIELYSDIANTWLVRAGGPVARGGCVAGAVQGFGYVAAGNGPSITNVNYYYNDTSDSYTSRTNYPASVTGPSSFVLNGLLYGVTGSTDGSSANGTTATYAYTHDLDSWATKASTSQILHRGAGFSVNGRGYLTGGRNSGGSFVTTVEQYSDVTNVWSIKSSLGTSTMTAMGATLNAAGYSAGGYNGSYLTANQKYDDQANSWSNKAGLLTALQEAGTFTLNSFIYYASGYSNSGVVSSSMQYNDAADAFASKAAPTVPRYGSTMNQTAGAIRKYEVRVGIPSYFAGLGAGVWIQKANMNNSRYSFMNSSFNLGNFGYIITQVTALMEKYSSENNVWINDVTAPAFDDYSGCTSLQGFAYTITSSSTAYKLNDALRAWTASANLISSVLNEAPSFALNGFIYVGGGNTGGGTPSATSQAYSPSTNSWTTVASRTISARYGSGFSDNGFGFCAGANTAVATVEQYNDAGNVWSTKTAMNTAKIMAGTFALSSGAILAGGNTDGGNATSMSDTEQYSSVSNIWIAKQTIAAASEMGGFTLNGSGYVCGSAVPTNTTQQYTPSLSNLVLGIGLRVTES